MKMRNFFQMGGWFSSFLFFVSSLIIGIYVLIRGAQAVTPPKIVPTEKKFLTAKQILESEKPSNNKNIVDDNTHNEEHSKSENTARPTPNRIKEPTFRLPTEGVMLPKLTSPGVAPKIVDRDLPMKFGVEASNPEPYPDPTTGLSPEELNAQREKQKADRDRRRLESLDERIQKLEERLNKVKSENPNDEQIDRLQKSIERLQKRREDLAREVKTGDIVE